jgi:hypothetical protein
MIFWAQQNDISTVIMIMIEKFDFWVAGLKFSRWFAKISSTMTGSWLDNFPFSTCLIIDHDHGT